MRQGHQEAEPASEEVDRVGRTVVDAALTVHRALGPGLPGSVWETCLAEELLSRRLRVERQVGVPVAYGTVHIDVGYRLDLLIERQVVVEIKSIDALAAIHVAQLLTYLRFSRVRLGYLINFNTVLLKNGIRRLVV